MASKAKQEVTVQVELDAAGAPITSNYSVLTYPTDIWGLTSNVKEDIKHIAARICGSEDKYNLVKESLRIALAYLEVRYADDNKRLKNV